MSEIDIELAGEERAEDVIERIDRAAASCGLTVTMKGALKTYPGSTHWHCKLGREPGTLEITYWPRKPRLWVKVVESRRAPWMDEVVPRLRRTLTGSS